MSISTLEIEKLKFEDLKLINETINLLTEKKKIIEEEDRKELIITDHAVVRYLERIEKRDIKSEIKREMEKRNIPKLLEVVGSGTFGIGNFRAVITEKTLVKTIF